ncbi:MAG: hypothetical protein GYB66_00190 [Chloroflexi bacterium]|nr:hypothetical protein [Chloroflexota bacterium]
MTDIFDLLGAAGDKQQNDNASPSPGKQSASSEEEEPAATSDDLAFLGDFKKRVTSRRARSERTAKQSESSTSAGITPLDIAGLPENQRQIMFFMLRNKHAAKHGITLAELQARFDKMSYLEDILAKLTQEGWLLVIDEEPSQRYKLNLRRKAARLGLD